jgi:hypothetical protein
MSASESWINSFHESLLFTSGLTKMIENWKQVLPDYIGSTDPQGLPDSSTKYLFPNPY